MIRIGSALFNADHTRLGDELRRVEAAGVEFIHFDVFDGRFVSDLAFPPRTIQALRPLTTLPFEVHLAAEEPLRFIPALKHAGVNLIFLPAESTPLLYEAIFSVREQGMQVGLCLALGTSLSVLEPVVPLLDAVLLLGRVTGEGQRGRTFNNLLLPRIQAVAAMCVAAQHPLDIQAAGGLETTDCQAVVAAGATSLPIGNALHREADLRAYVGLLRTLVNQQPVERSHQDSAEAAAVELPQRNWNVLIASRSFGPHCPAALERMRAAGCNLIANSWGRAPTEEQLLAAISDVDVLISGTEPVTARVLAAAPRLRVISKHGVGYENIDLDAARAHNIPVAIAGGAITESVADMTLALMLAVLRGIPRGDRAVRNGQWPRMVGRELSGMTLGIVGLGQIGKAVCRRAAGFGMRVVAFDQVEDQQFARAWAVRYLPLPELLAEADIVTLHTPVHADTRGLINAATLARMRPGAFLINTARGELVDETALAEALRSGHLGGAACDVFVQEPPPADHPLLLLDNFIAAPHSAGQTREGLQRMGEITADNALRVLAGQEPRYRVA